MKSLKLTSISALAGDLRRLMAGINRANAKGDAEEALSCIDEALEIIGELDSRLVVYRDDFRKMLG